MAALQAALREERQLLQTLIDQLPDLIFVKNRDSRFLIANRATARVMGVGSSDDLVGRCDHDFYPHEMADLFRADEVGAMREDRAVLNREERVLDPSGGEHWLQTTKVPLRDEAGVVIGLIGVSRDITGRRKVEEALLVENRQLKDLTGRCQEEILRLRAELARTRGG